MPKNNYCPNIIAEDASTNVSMGEFKTIQDAMNFPISGIWCINRVGDGNKFEKYKNIGTRILIICSWQRLNSDCLKYVVVLISTEGKCLFFNMNDITIYPESAVEEYKSSLGEIINNALSKIVQEQKVNNSNDASGNIIHESKKIMMTEAQLHYIIHEAIKENLYI